ncbi:MAG: type II toxin-antitoxin system VapC family toxin [Pseudomonadota bacterium]
MILVDTNVVSELAQPKPHPLVVDWYRANRSYIGLPTIVVTELYYGVFRMNAGKRQTQLQSFYDQMLDFHRDTLIPFDMSAAFACAEITVVCDKSGRPIDAMDAQIAAIAKVHKSQLATRNMSDFEVTGIKLINPWTDEHG